MLEEGLCLFVHLECVCVCAGVCLKHVHVFWAIMKRYDVVAVSEMPTEQVEFICLLYLCFCAASVYMLHSPNFSWLVVSCIFSPHSSSRRTLCVNGNVGVLKGGGSGGVV